VIGFFVSEPVSLFLIYHFSTALVQRYALVILPSARDLKIPDRHKLKNIAEGRRKKEEGRGRKEEGGRKREEGKNKKQYSARVSAIKNSPVVGCGCYKSQADTFQGARCKKRLLAKVDDSEDLRNIPYKLEFYRALSQLPPKS
jgi:hypothetical protein